MTSPEKLTYGVLEEKRPEQAKRDEPDYGNLLLFSDRAEELQPALAGNNLRVGYLPAMMPGKWFNRWHRRFASRCPLVEIPLAEGKALAALEGETPLAHMVLVRPEAEPACTDKKRYHMITLYREKQVVILPKDHLLTIYEENVPLEELAEEFMLQEPESAPAWAEISAEYRVAHPQRLPEMRHTQDAVELVAAGLGLLLVPLSVARFYHRKDLTYRIVEELGESEVALLWLRKERSEEEETTFQDFVGICRGRTEGSDRGSESMQAQKKRQAAEKAREKQKRRAANTRRETKDRKAHNAKRSGNSRQHAAKIKGNAQARKKKR